jgi:predicted GNAT family acetyltransferase
MPDSAEVTRNADAKRFEIGGTDGSEPATLDYFQGTRHITLIHTEVPPALAGKGYGGMLARAGFEYARASGLAVIVECPFVQSWLTKHPEYADLVRPA